MDETDNTYGANGPGSSMTPTHGVLLIIGASAALLIALGVIFRRTS
jgi:hypothetical protein